MLVKYVSIFVKKYENEGKRYYFYHLYEIDANASIFGGKK